MKLLKKLIFLLVPVMMLSSCRGDDPEPVRPTVRTVLVYMVANNSLGESGYNYDTLDLDEMRRGALAGQLGDSRWIVYHHAYRTDPVLLEVTEDGLKEIKKYDTSVSSVSASRMTEVISDVKAFAPAGDYGLILWSHASGWPEDGIDESDLLSSRSYGQDNGKTMNITTLARVLSGKGFSFIYNDCCNMAGVEVAYELRGVTEWFLGSSTELPGDGTCYDRTMRYFTSAQADLRSVAETTYNYYVTRPSSAGAWYTAGLVRMDAMDALAAETRRVYTNSVYPAGYVPVNLDIQPGRKRYYDFRNFAEALAPADQAWTDAFNAAVVFHIEMPRFGSLDVSEQCGLATFIQRSVSDAAYKGYDRLQWYTDVARFQPLPEL